VTGSLLPDTVQNITLNSPKSVALSHDVVVNGNLNLANGVLNLAGNKLAYGKTGTLIYSATFAQTTTDSEFPESNGPWNLINDNKKGIILHASRTISDLKLNYKLDLGANTLSLNSISNIGLNTYITTTDGGQLARTGVGSSQVLFPVGTTSYSPVWITNTGTSDRISVGVVRDTDESSSKGRVRLKWIIGEEVPGGGNYAMQFGWTTAVENTAFKNNRANCSKIYNLTDSIEAGTGNYTTQLTKQPYTVARGGIVGLGEFGVGLFSGLTGLDETRNPYDDGFILSQNFPNPFSSSTMINFELPEKSFVSLKISNLLGEEIADLAGKEYPSGSHSVTFDATHLNKGIYFYTLKANNFAQTRKMILVK
jgi:hypothetical protein